jgi:hypothetical protein
MGAAVYCFVQPAKQEAPLFRGTTQGDIDENVIESAQSD